ncbi:HRDC domain-containing protein, partial [Desulfobacterales bacterium HSG17]|nr:HRDC domain-containing protein [Desulfobacterales bacterium HSG17]
SWAKEEFEIQEQVRYKNNHSSPLFKKFKGAGKIDNRSLAVLENLLQLRIQIAQKKDQPLFKIISNASLMTLSMDKPETIEQILEIKALSKRQVEMYGSFCVQAITGAMELEDEQLPIYPRTKRPKRDFKVEKRITKLKKMREQLSTFIGIEPGFLLNNALISSIALQKPANSAQLLSIEHVRRWQVENIGEDIFAAFEYDNS